LTLDYPNDPRFREKYQALLKQAENFKHDVLKLADDFNKIPINTKRLRKAKQHFDKGEYKAALDELNVEAMSHDQDALLTKQQRLDTQQAEVSKQLTDNATEFLLKARLTAIDYSLTDRIAQTSQFFEQALKSARTPENMFDYAFFLQENALVIAATNIRAEIRQLAEQLYKEVLAIYRQLAKDNPFVYLSDVASILNNLGTVVSADTLRRAEAESLYKEALVIRHQLAKDNPSVYLSDVAGTLHNLGVLVSADTLRRAEAETLYKEALAIRHQLAKDNPAVYLPKVAITLNNLGDLVNDDTNRKAEAKQLYKEALVIHLQLEKNDHAVYLFDVAMCLNILGLFVSVDTQRWAEAETLYKEDLAIHRQLAKDNPIVHLPNVVNTLCALGEAHLHRQEPQQALIYLQEAETLLEPFAKQIPELFAEQHAKILRLIAQAKQK
jgi:tetratricopeptide (TPR) repeat protein